MSMHVPFSRALAAALALFVATGWGGDARADARPATSSIVRSKVQRTRGTLQPHRHRQSVRRPIRDAHGVRAMLRAAGVGKKSLSLAAANIALGLPTPANKNDPSDFLLARKGYVISYNKASKVANWASWRMTPANLGDAKRPSSRAFRADPTLPASWKPAQDSDYRHSGYSRGHLVPSYARSSGKRASRKTFVLTNVMPQSKESNSGPWESLESHARTLVEGHGKSIHWVAGGLFEGPTETIGENAVAVPSAMWKVGVVLDKGQRVADISASNRVISIIVPNRAGTVDQRDTFATYRVTAKEVERRAGVSLFTHLDGEVRAALLNKIDTVEIPAKRGGKKKANKERRRLQGSSGPRAPPSEARAVLAPVKHSESPALQQAAY